jgi:hypothetical protein
MKMVIFPLFTDWEKYRMRIIHISSLCVKTSSIVRTVFGWPSGYTAPLRLADYRPGLTSGGRSKSDGPYFLGDAWRNNFTEV